jgi:peroxiredoxin
MALAIGDPVPSFELPDTEGGTWSSAPDGASATVIVWTCNHCPYALAWHERILDVARDYAGRGVRVVQVNANDAERYPRDSFDAMKQRAAAEQWPTPYLHDATQEVAREFGARVTPDVFVFDSGGRLRYRGAPDGDYGDAGQRAAWLRGALDAVLAGSEPDQAETEPVGCSIKWKQ